MTNNEEYLESEAGKWKHLREIPGDLPASIEKIFTDRGQCQAGILDVDV